MSNTSTIPSTQLLLTKSAVEILKLPPLAIVIIITGLHRQLVLAVGEGKALPADRVVEPPPLMAVLPLLVATAPVAREENDILAGKVQTSLITAYLTLF